MNSPFRSSTPDDIRPYIPSWSRQQPSSGSGGYDIFSDEENPSYREMARMFAPQQHPPENESSRGSSKMLLRFLGIVGAAAAVLGLFVGYVVTQPDGALVAGRDSGGMTMAIDAVQATFAASVPQPAAEPAVPAGIAAPVEEPSEPAPAPQETVTGAAAPASADPVPAAAPEPAPAPVAAVEPVAISAQPEIPPQPAPQVAALTQEAEPAPPAPAIPDLTPSELATLMSRGRRFVENGDFASARPVYRRAAEAGYAEAALALGETYDPHTLAQRGAVGISPNIEEARRWYMRARDMGSLEAPTRLERLAR